MSFINYAEVKKMNKTQLIDTIKCLEINIKDLQKDLAEVEKNISSLYKEKKSLDARLRREQFSHEMTCAEAEEYRNQLLNERLHSDAERNHKEFYIDSSGKQIEVRRYSPPYKI
jgi:regulator of replication initiation timing